MPENGNDDDDGDGDRRQDRKKRKRRLRISVHQGVFKATQEDGHAAPVKGPP